MPINFKIYSFSSEKHILYFYEKSQQFDTDPQELNLNP